MKLKTLLTLVALTGILPATAVETSTTLCRIAVHSDTASTLISVPFTAVDGSAIKIADIVLSDNLTSGDSTTADVLIVGKNSWYLTANGWEPFAQNAEDAPTTLARGSAIRIDRKGDLTKPFYLYGKLDETALTSPTINMAESDSTYGIVPTYTLIGNPNAADIDMNAEGVWSNCSDGDQIMWFVDTGLYIYECSGSKWGKLEKTDEETVTIMGKETTVPVITFVRKTVTLPAGQGFWYASKSLKTSENVAPTFDWKLTK